MGSKGVKKGFKVVLITFLILIVLAGGVLYFFFNFLMDIVKNGDRLNGSWDYQGKEVLNIDVDKKTYSLQVDGVSEEGKIVNLEYKEGKDGDEGLNYVLTLDGGGEHTVKVYLDTASSEDVTTMHYTMHEQTQEYVFTQDVD